MGKAQTIRIATALTVIGIGVPLTVIANSHGATAGILPGAATQLGATGSSTSGSSVAAAGTSGSSTSSGTTSGSASSTGTTGNLPADKMTVTASKAVVSSPNTDVVVLQAQMRTSNPADLTFMLTSECSIVTSVTTMGNDTQSAFGQVRMWVTIDDQPVGVIPATQGLSDDGHVVFCNQAYSSSTSGFVTDSNATIKTGLATEHADGFNWVAMNVGNGVHTIQVHAELTQQVNDPSKDSAQAFIGNRTLVVNTTQTAQNQAQ